MSNQSCKTCHDWVFILIFLVCVLVFIIQLACFQIIFLGIIKTKQTIIETISIIKYCKQTNQM